MREKKQHIFFLIESALIFSVLFVFILGVKAQQPPAQPKIIEMRNAGELVKRPSTEAQIFLNDVVFYHEGAFMYCDSAY
ncbi:MAG TPA: OstA-like protein, partial [Dysgonamonadaceae bacterium]|nr:OstA-like protein [Dysgonamonadaceae bacterium]